MSMHHHHCAPASATRRALYIALLLNGAMFFLEIWQGMRADSTSLLADAADFCSDSISYIITLYVLSRPLKTRAHASIFKAVLMLGLSAAALIQGLHNIIHHQTPAYMTMGWVGALALMANIASAAVLYRTRLDDSNMRSVWLCSRNDAIANVLIMLAALAIYLTHSLWPDLVVALFIAWMEGRSAIHIIRHAKSEMNEAPHC